MANGLKSSSAGIFKVFLIDVLDETFVDRFFPFLFCRVVSFDDFDAVDCHGVPCGFGDGSAELLRPTVNPVGAASVIGLFESQPVFRRSRTGGDNPVGIFSFAAYYFTAVIVTLGEVFRNVAGDFTTGNTALVAESTGALKQSEVAADCVNCTVAPTGQSPATGNGCQSLNRQCGQIGTNRTWRIAMQTAQKRKSARYGVWFPSPPERRDTRRTQKLILAARVATYCVRSWLASHWSRTKTAATWAVFRFKFPPRTAGQ